MWRVWRVCLRIAHPPAPRGINTMAAYITRSSLELQLLCKAMGGQPETISGLSGIGGASLLCTAVDIAGMTADPRTVPCPSSAVHRQT